jgi:hypothetical protein
MSMAKITSSEIIFFCVEMYEGESVNRSQMEVKLL